MFVHNQFLPHHSPPTTTPSQQPPQPPLRQMGPKTKPYRLGTAWPDSGKRQVSNADQQPTKRTRRTTNDANNNNNKEPKSEEQEEVPEAEEDDDVDPPLGHCREVGNEGVG